MIRSIVEENIARGEAPGAVALVSRRGEVEVAVAGVRSLDTREPMTRDSIFRIASMTKPVTAVAAMMLIEDRQLSLDQSIEHFLPELADRRVLKRVDGPLEETVPAKRAITVRDLLNFKLGFGALLTSDPLPILEAEKKNQLCCLGPPTPVTPHTPDEWIARFATLPLMYQPGEKWLYSTSAQVLGVLLERAAKQSLETLFQERIFAPLGMRDTSFTVSAEQRARFTSAYSKGEHGFELSEHAQNSVWTKPRPFRDAAGGLISTADDFYRFARVLLAGGEHEGGRLLEASSIEAMTTNSLAPAERSAAKPFLDDDRGWGLGLGVEVGAHAGRYGWDGGFGTTWANCPREQLIGVMLTTCTWDSPEMPRIMREFWDAA